MSAATKTYRAKTACRVGGLYRQAGEFFDLPADAPVLPCVELVGEQDASVSAQVNKAGKTPTVPKAAQVNKDELTNTPGV